MLITHTERERVPVLPRFRVVAVSMECLQIGITCVTAVTVAVIDLDSVIMLEEQPTRATTPLLCFEQFGESGPDMWVASLAPTPVHTVTIIGTAVASDLDMPGEGHLAVCEEVRGVEIGGGSGKGQTHASPVPVPLHPPGGGFLRVAPVRPAAEFGPGKVVKPVIDRLAHPSAVIVRPTPDDGVELAEQLPVREGLGMPNDPPKLRQMLLNLRFA
jgi:hypothetical protein